MTEMLIAMLVSVIPLLVVVCIAVTLARLQKDVASIRAALDRSRVVPAPPSDGE